MDANVVLKCGGPPSGCCCFLRETGGRVRKRFWRQEETGKVYPAAVIGDTGRVHDLGVQ